MGKQLIRNGSFERGNFDFWELLQGAITIEDTIVKRGGYAAKLEHAVSGSPELITKDYIPIIPYSLYSLSTWSKNVDNNLLYTYLKLYDGDYNFIENYATECAKAGIYDWTQLFAHVVIPVEASYARVFIEHNGTGIHVGYIDSISLQKLKLSDILTKNEELISVINDTTKHTVTGEPFYTDIWKEAEYFFDLTSFTETGAGNPVTIDVKIQTYDFITAKWRDAMVFQQKSCPASGSVTTQEYKNLASNLGWKQRVSYTTAGAGTIGDCDFKVGVVYKR